MDKDIAAAIGTTSTVTVLVAVYPNTVTVVLASLFYLFYGVQIFDNLTFMLNDWHAAFPALPICYVCGAVGGTWLITGLYLGLLPVWTMMFLSGMSVMAVVEWLVEERGWNLWTASLVLYNVAFACWLAYDVLIAERPGQFILGGLLLWIGALIHQAAAWLDSWREMKAEQGDGTYYDMEENIVLLVGILLVVSVVYLLI